MRLHRLRCLAASCLGLLMALPAPAQEAATVPPWGRDFAPPAAHADGSEAHPGEAPRAEAAAPRGLAFWFNAEYLLWWTRNGTPPPLITRGETSDPLPGALGQTNTKLIYGGNAQEINFEDRHGARFTVGVPVGGEDAYGVEAGYLFLTARDVGTTLTSGGNPILARPFFNALTNQNDSSLTTYPGLAHGSIAVRDTSFLQGAEGNFSALLWQNDKNRLTLLTGFRYLNLNEDVSIAENTIGDAAALQFAGTTIGVLDRFATWNNFYGGQLGLRSQHTFGRFQLNLLGKLALGDSHESVLVRGHTVATTAIPIDAPAGLLALGSNSGVFTRNRFAVVPELGANIGLRVTDQLTLTAGYTFLYWSAVARPADQIDTSLNPNLIPTSNTYGTAGGPARPAAGIRTTAYWAQGFTAGLTFRY